MHHALPRRMSCLSMYVCMLVCTPSVSQFQEKCPPYSMFCFLVSYVEFVSCKLSFIPARVYCTIATVSNDLQHRSSDPCLRPHVCAIESVPRALSRSRNCRGWFLCYCLNYSVLDNLWCVTSRGYQEWP